MPPKGHAILSASSSDRWLHCPPSARLCETYEDKGSNYAAEGTDAHTNSAKHSVYTFFVAVYGFIIYNVGKIILYLIRYAVCHIRRDINKYKSNKDKQ